MMGVHHYYRPFLVDISDNPTNGASVSYNLGAEPEATPPISILCPSNLQNADRVKFQVSMDNTTFYDVLVNGSVVTLALTAGAVISVPGAIGRACLGWDWIRLMTTDAAEAAEEPAADITFFVAFAKTVPDETGDSDAALSLANGTGYTVATGEVAGNAAATAFPALACKWVKIKAEYNNAGRVYVGVTSGVTKQDGSSDATTGWELSAGEETPWIPIANMSSLYRICDNAGDDVTYMALV